MLDIERWDDFQVNRKIDSQDKAHSYSLCMGEKCHEFGPVFPHSSSSMSFFIKWRTCKGMTLPPEYKDANGQRGVTLPPLTLGISGVLPMPRTWPTLLFLNFALHMHSPNYTGFFKVLLYSHDSETVFNTKLETKVNMWKKQMNKNRHLNERLALFVLLLYKSNTQECPAKNILDLTKVHTRSLHIKLSKPGCLTVKIKQVEKGQSDYWKSHEVKSCP